MSIAASIEKKLAIVMISTSRLRDVRELVREHALDLARLEPLPEARASPRPPRASGCGPSRTRSARRVSMIATRGFGRSAMRAEPLDHVVQLGRLVARRRSSRPRPRARSCRR